MQHIDAAAESTAQCARDVASLKSTIQDQRALLGALSERLERLERAAFFDGSRAMHAVLGNTLSDRKFLRYISPCCVLRCSARDRKAN